MLRKIFVQLLRQLEARIDLVKLSVIERTSLIMGFTMFIGLIGIIGASVVIFLGVGLSIYLGEVFDSHALGYVATAGVYLLLFIIAVLLRKSITGLIAGIFVDLFTHDLEKEFNDSDLDTDNND